MDHLFSELPLRHRDRERATAGEIVFSETSGRLFAETPRATDARQGLIGDCYFLSSLSALARSAPDKLKAMFVENADNSVSVRFHRRLGEGKFAPEQVTIARTVPTRSGAPIYARSGVANEVWPLLAEKAYAAWKGGYHVMGEGGLVEHTLEELTGEPTRMLFVAESKPESLWSLLARATKEGWPAAVCTYGRRERPAIDELGFHPNHILVFLGVHEWMGRRIVWLRDPFDIPACGTLVHPDPQGVFTLSWENFLNYFAEVELNGSAACAVEMPPYPSHSLKEALDRSYVFHALKPADRARLAKEFKRVHFAAGDIVSGVKEMVQNFHIVQHGSIAVELPTKKGGPLTTVNVLHAGDQFGEAHALQRRPMDAQFRALTDLTLFRLDIDRFFAWTKKFPELVERFFRRWDLRLTMLEWGKHQITTLNVDSMLSAGKSIEAKRGEILYRPGDTASGVYFVVEGSVQVKQDGRTSRHTAGQVFGEGEVLKRTPRKATAKAASRALILHLDIGEAAALMQNFDVIQRQLAAIAERRELARMGKRKHL